MCVRVCARVIVSVFGVREIKRGGDRSRGTERVHEGRANTEGEKKRQRQNGRYKRGQAFGSCRCILAHAGTGAGAGAGAATAAAAAVTTTTDRYQHVAVGVDEPKRIVDGAYLVGGCGAGR